MMERLSVLKRSEDIKQLISFPSLEDSIQEDRIKELESIGITSILSYGKTKIGNLSVLGKGCVGLTLPVIHRKKMRALKVRRTDANRDNMYNEVIMHSIANTVNVGPILIDFTENFILMEFIDGTNIFDWLFNKVRRRHYVYQVIASSLEQCFALDQIKLDHGQLSYLKHHLIISSKNQPKIIDFESSSMRRRTANVSSLVHNFLWASSFYSKLKYELTYEKKLKILQLLKDYKSCKTRARFVGILDFFNSQCD
jgi:putative serine/threonine protein kinase